MKGRFPENSRTSDGSSLPAAKLLIYNIHIHTVCKKRLGQFIHLQRGVAVQWRTVTVYRL